MRMYKNAGKSIKEWVKISVVFMMLIWIVFAIVVSVMLYKLFGGIAILLAVSVMVIGCFLIWLSGLMLYAYGDIADNIKTIRKIAENSQNSAKNKKDTDVRKEERKWRCANCGTENENENTYCVACDVSRAWSEAYWDKNN